MAKISFFFIDVKSTIVAENICKSLNGELLEDITGRVRKKMKVKKYSYPEYIETQIQVIL